MNFLLILTFAFLYSCSTTLDFHMPTQNFSSPEVVGKSLGLRGQGTLSNSTKFKVATLETFDLLEAGVVQTFQQSKGLVKIMYYKRNLVLELEPP